MSTAAGSDLYTQKKRADARLNSTKMRLRDWMLRQSRKRHFRSADTRALDTQFSAAVAQSAPKESKPQAAAKLLRGRPPKLILNAPLQGPAGAKCGFQATRRVTRPIQASFRITCSVV